MTVFFGQYIEKYPLFTFVKCRLPDFLYSSPLEYESQAIKSGNKAAISKQESINTNMARRPIFSPYNSVYSFSKTFSKTHMVHPWRFLSNVHRTQRKCKRHDDNAEDKDSGSDDGQTIKILLENTGACVGIVHGCSNHIRDARSLTGMCQHQKDG